MTTYHQAIESLADPPAAYPPSSPMRLSFDVDALRADLDLLRHQRWRAQRAYSQTAPPQSPAWTGASCRCAASAAIRYGPTRAARA
ncbi:hypothetical protein GCM10010191_21280 [Actinomadura vinacea]|uniref:Uncharacterized protein n=1 Tax=Actinomadura vinacea TaxID=115336 RepID=A0ABN3ISA4_9ACTN